MKAHIGWLFTFLRKTVNSLGTPWGPHGQDLFRKLNIFEMQKACKRNVCRLFIWRSRRDSNPGALADKRFSRPPRYDHFDTAPYAVQVYRTAISIQKSVRNFNQELKLTCPGHRNLYIRSRSCPYRRFCRSA